MMIRLTTPEALDRVIDFLERKRHLEWPQVTGMSKSYRDYSLEDAKEKMRYGTVLMEVNWQYDHDRNRIVASAHFIAVNELDTDEMYLDEEEEGEEEDEK